MPLLSLSEQVAIWDNIIARMCVDWSAKLTTSHLPLIGVYQYQLDFVGGIILVSYNSMTSKGWLVTDLYPAQWLWLEKVKGWITVQDRIYFFSSDKEMEEIRYKALIYWVTHRNEIPFPYGALEEELTSS